MRIVTPMATMISSMLSKMIPTATMIADMHSVAQYSFIVVRSIF